MPRARKDAVQIRFEVLEYLYFARAPVAGALAVMTGTLATPLQMGIVAQVGMTITALTLKNPRTT